MKIIISPDSFKGTLTSGEVTSVIKEAIKKVDNNIETICLPIADGGEGTLDALVKATKGKYLTASVQNPLGKLIEAKYGVLGDGKTCVIEMAQASGLTLINEKEKNPRFATTYGTGQLIQHAMDAGYRHFIIGIGGSATNDGGQGMLRALGMKFIAKDGKEILNDVFQFKELEKIDLTNFDSRISESTFMIACDVDNPLIGSNGATSVFGPQKGVDPHDINIFDQNLNHYITVIESQQNVTVRHCAGAGAAGGIGSAFMAFFPHQFKPGVDIVLEAVQFSNHLEHADFVITGEGKSDEQTLSGKAPIGVAKLAKEQGVPTILLSGIIENSHILRTYFHQVESIVSDEISAEQSLNNPSFYLDQKVMALIERLI